MAAPTYAHDLTDWILDSDTTAWTELTGATSGGAPDEADTESALQGTNSCSQTNSVSGLYSMCRILASPITLSSGQVFLVWHGHGVATALDSYANGGLRLAVASSVANWKAWAVGGYNVPPFPYTKWVNNPIDPTVTAEYTGGTPPTGATNIYGVGSMCALTATVAKGQPHIVDIIRYGRAEARISGGSSGDGYATFAGFAALNDAQTARWGLIQATDGGYLWKGLMTLGYGSAVEFVDSNKTIFVQDTRKVTSTFNKIEIRQTTSVITWTGISLTCLSPSTTASKGAFEVIDNADVNLSGCTFTDLSTFIFQSNSTIVDSTFRRCDQVTGGGASFDGCLFTNSTAAVSLVLTNLSQTTDCSFISDGSNHAVNLGTISSSISMNWNNYLTSYASSDGSSGNEAILVSVASGQTLTINVGIGYSSPSIYNTGSGTVNVVASVPVNITVVDVTNTPVQTAQAAVYLSSDDSELVNTDTDVNGEVAFDYGGSTPANIYTRVRKSSTGSTKYVPVSSSGTINSGGYSATITLIEDTTATT
jgi:hypothetical protein